MATENTPDPAAPDTIVLIHGLWVTPRSWEKWAEHYEGKGYRVLTPAYPGFEVEVEALNEDPSPIEASTIPGVVEHLESIVGELENPPIIMGHSFGGTFTQILLDHGYGAAGVVIDSAPSRGHQGNPGLTDKIPLPDSEEPRQPPQGGGLHERAVPQLLRQYFEPGGLRRGLRAIPHPCSGQLRVGPGAGQLHARTPGHLRRLQERRAGALAVHSGWRRQPHAPSGQPVQRQALPPRQERYGLQGVPWPLALHGRGGWMGGGSRLRP